jgi:hypothetical protein
MLAVRFQLTPGHRKDLLRFVADGSFKYQWFINDMRPKTYLPLKYQGSG